MDGTHPNRKKDKLNPYTLSVENNTYHVSFTDGQGIFHKMEIDEAMYAAFDDFELEDISHMNVVSRHLEQSKLTEETLNHRAVTSPEPVEDRVYRKLLHEQLHTAIGHLPAVQRRRLLLHYFGGYTYEEIAKIEGCTKMAVKFSIDIAVKKLREKI
ncbi:MAG: RNA polymerase sigma factor [Faecousia sp.]